MQTQKASLKTVVIMEKGRWLAWSLDYGRT
jgi:hypothetical protein